MEIVNQFLELRQKASSGGWRQRAKSAFSSKHILVCAQSNSAVDDLTERIARAFPQLSEETKPGLVRVGQGISKSSGAWKYSLDELVKSQADNVVQIKADAVSRLESEIDEINQKISALDNGDKEQMEVLKSDKAKISSKLHIAMQDLKAAKSKEANQYSSRKKEILENAIVVCATLSSSGLDMFSKLDHGFDTVILDESAQAVELSSLIPLQLGCKRCVLVGDPQQLPPTLLSQTAAELGYGRSLFERLMNLGCPNFAMLEVQYRMNPEISLFPRNFFYGGKLQDADSTLEYSSGIHKLFGHYRFFDIKSFENRRASSISNEIEATFAVRLFEKLFKSPEYSDKLSFGFVTPYQEQVRTITRLARKFPTDVEDSLRNAFIKTVDSFQGQERDVIIFSCVRARRKDGSRNSSIGFVADVRRLNVALTRAKQALYIIGCSDVLRSNDAWKACVENAEERGLLTKVDDSISFFNDPDSFINSSQTISSKMPGDPKRTRADSAFGHKLKKKTWNVSENQDQASTSTTPSTFKEKYSSFAEFQKRMATTPKSEATAPQNTSTDLTNLSTELASKKPLTGESVPPSESRVSDGKKKRKSWSGGFDRIPKKTAP